MTAALTRILRIALPGQPGGILTDFDTGEDPVIWNGDALDIQLWCGVTSPFDIEEIEEIRLEIKASSGAEDLLIPALTLEAADLEKCDFADWQSEESQHGTFETEDELSFETDVTSVWASFRAKLTTGGYRTLGAGRLKVNQAGAEAIDSLVTVEHLTGSDTLYTPAANTAVARGNALRTAVAAATTAGDTVIASGSGIWDLGGHRLALSHNTHLTLLPGIDIASSADLVTDGCIIYPGNNSVISLRGASITPSGSGSLYQACIGVVEDVGDTARTGVIVIGGTLNGDSDAFYIQHTTPCTATLTDVAFNTKWDACTVTGSSSGDVAHVVNVVNPRMTCTGPSATGSQQCRGFVASDGATINIYGGFATSTGGGTSLNTCGFVERNGVLNFFDVTLTTSNPGTPAVCFDLTQTGTGVINVTGGSGSGPSGAYTTSGTVNITP